MVQNDRIIPVVLLLLTTWHPVHVAGLETSIVCTIIKTFESLLLGSLIRSFRHDVLTIVSAHITFPPIRATPHHLIVLID